MCLVLSMQLGKHMPAHQIDVIEAIQLVQCEIYNEGVTTSAVSAPWEPLSEAGANQITHTLRSRFEAKCSAASTGTSHVKNRVRACVRKRVHGGKARNGRNSEKFGMAEIRTSR